MNETCILCGSVENVSLYADSVSISWDSNLETSPLGDGGLHPVCCRCRHDLGFYTSEEYALAAQIIQSLLPRADGTLLPGCDYLLNRVRFKSGAVDCSKRRMDLVECAGGPISEMIIRERR